MLYNVVLVCAARQCELAIGVHTSPLPQPASQPPVPPSRSSQSSEPGSLRYMAASHYLFYMSVPLSQFFLVVFRQCAFEL